MYGIYLTLASALLLAYVLWRASSIPRFRKIPRPAFLFAALFLALLLFLGRFLGHDASGSYIKNCQFKT